jgi:cyclomaltodextrinase / maltogenic alpha-amylase / neopullulanase
MRSLNLPLKLALMIGGLAGSAGTSHAQDLAMKISLDGAWMFRPDSQKAGMEEGWYKPDADRSAWVPVEVPRFWEGYLGLATYDGWGWFARRFDVQKPEEPLSLHFAGVDDDATVWVNGMVVGSHTGYSEPFVVNIAPAVHSGENLVVVQVVDHAGGGGIYRPVTIIETRALDNLLKSPYSGKPALRSADWVKDAVLYEVYLRSFSKEGTFAGLERKLPEIKALGATVVWLMPIHPVGVMNRKGKLGSPYAVQDFYGINPEFGTLEDFKRLLDSAHRNGLKLIIDLVANHTSWDSRLMKEHPEWFTRDPQGKIVAPNQDWTDVADLDYGNSGLRAYMMEMMRWWVRDVGIDGFRCDVAEMVPTDFWEEARARLNRIKPVLMLSEGTLPEHHMKAFDLTYSWNVYDILDPLLQGRKSATLLDEIFKAELLQFPKGALRMRFNTNHDKNAWDAPAVTKFGLDGLELTAVLINTIPGVPLIYNGEEVANDRKLSLFEKVNIDWTRPAEMGALYQKLFRLRREHKALSRGEMIRVKSSDAENLYAFFRLAGSDRMLVVLNFSAAPCFSRLDLALSRIVPRVNSVTFTEVFTGEVIRMSPAESEPMDLDLAPREFRVFTLTSP